MMPYDVPSCPPLAAGGDKVQVGIVHNYMVYEPKHPLAISAAWVGPIVRVINQAWVSAALHMQCPNAACHSAANEWPHLVQGHKSKSI